MSRSETNSPPVSTSNGIPASFVAQILGQVLATDGADAALAVRAYARPQHGAGSQFIRWA
jgi:hypothetical protein